MTDPAVVAAKPFLLSIIADAKQVNLDAGADPSKWGVTYPLAFASFIAKFDLKLLALAPAEGAALQTDMNTKLDALAAQVQAL